MTLRHLASVLLLSGWFDLEIRCSPPPESRAEPGQPRVSAIASRVQALESQAHESIGESLAGDEELTAAVSWHLGHLRGRLADVDALIALPLVCLGSTGVLWQDLAPLRAMAANTHELLDQWALLLSMPPPDGSLQEALDEPQGALVDQLRQMNAESIRLVTEAGVHGCPL